MVRFPLDEEHFLFSKEPRHALGPMEVSVQWLEGLFPGGGSVWPGSKSHHCPASSTEVKKEWKYRFFFLFLFLEGFVSFRVPL